MNLAYRRVAGKGRVVARLYAEETYTASIRVRKFHRNLCESWPFCRSGHDTGCPRMSRTPSLEQLAMRCMEQNRRRRETNIWIEYLSTMALNLQD
ncbi:hypothetical protein AVEN_223587-1 [Araneus ventricosus]|uniref:Uncharacterized protein n=1 Tax=Araneus ventricosus TaxID=182803 RepID=A0A4Y2HJS7_ARAVE|nr:hypothetical protein AVEN_223587-1 [Araneus ventricosus]